MAAGGEDHALESIAEEHASRRAAGGARTGERSQSGPAKSTGHPVAMTSSREILRWHLTIVGWVPVPKKP
jgi:hypothetical protein